ncbi:MAG: NADH-quinone oxidoreductase subunit A [Deltaproteobacteria bacterium]|nr:NADH-quinone oxidoreductase subunit A [Deltaproteobacteria bacterium]
MSQILSLLIFAGVVFLFVFGMWVLSFLFGPKNTTKAKSRPFECGMEPIGPNRTRFSIQYYLYAILLVIFDVEVVFLVPLLVVFRENTLLVYLAVAIFLITAFVGYVYVYRRGGFEFEE